MLYLKRKSIKNLVGQKSLLKKISHTRPKGEKKNVRSTLLKRELSTP
tara:strand:- start:2029 stop:2169 length:141 start_codon:yes stop_codon:yes gene_type:complete